MAKLYFRYGTMGSAKTLNLLAVAHTYQLQGKKVLILKPAMDDRFGKATVKSRTGLEKDADLLMKADSRLNSEHLQELSCVLVDEAQFLSANVIEHLREIATDYKIPVICYGLRTDFRTELFPGSKRLLELADAVEEIKSTCTYCNKKAIFNMRLVDNVPTLAGPQVLLGAEESYLPACSHCYRSKLQMGATHDLGKLPASESSSETTSSP